MAIVSSSVMYMSRVILFMKLFYDTTLLIYKLYPTWMNLIYSLSFSYFSLCNRNANSVFPRQPYHLFLGVLNDRRHRQQMMEETEDTKYPPMPSSLHQVGSNISTFYGFYTFRTCSSDLKCRFCLHWPLSWLKPPLHVFPHHWDQKWLPE